MFRLTVNIGGMADLYTCRSASRSLRTYAPRTPDAAGRHGPVFIERLRFDMTADYGRPRYLLLMAEADVPSAVRHEIIMQLETEVGADLDGILRARNLDETSENRQRVHQACERLDFQIRTKTGTIGELLTQQDAQGFGHLSLADDDGSSFPSRAAVSSRAPWAILVVVVGISVIAVAVALPSSYRGLQNEISESAIELTTLNRNLEKLDTDVAGLTTAVETLRRSSLDLQSNVGSIDEEVSGLTKSVADLDRFLNDLRTRVDSIASELGNVAGLTKSVADLESSLRQLESRMNSIASESKEIADLQTSVSNLESAIRTLQSRVDLMAGRLEESKGLLGATGSTDESGAESDESTQE